MCRMGSLSSAKRPSGQLINLRGSARTVVAGLGRGPHSGEDQAGVSKDGDRPTVVPGRWVPQAPARTASHGAEHVSRGENVATGHPAPGGERLVEIETGVRAGDQTLGGVIVS